MSALDADTDQQFVDDVRRAIILGAYMAHWGRPEVRKVSRKDGRRIDTYSFAPNDVNAVHRFATCGASSFPKECGDAFPHEFLLSLPPELGGVNVDRVMDFVMDVFTHGLSEGVNYRRGTVVDCQALLPAPWSTDHLLLEEPLGESETLAVTHVGPEHIELLWMIPLHASEASFVTSHGFDALSELAQAEGVDLIDPLRDTLVPGSTAS